MERKMREEIYPKKIYAHQLIAFDDLQHFKKELVEELLTALNHKHLHQLKNG